MKQDQELTSEQVRRNLADAEEKSQDDMIQAKEAVKGLRKVLQQSIDSDTKYGRRAGLFRAGQLTLFPRAFRRVDLNHLKEVAQKLVPSVIEIINVEIESYSIDISWKVRDGQIR